MAPNEADKSDHYQSDDYDPFLSLKAQESLFEKCYGYARNWTLSWKHRLINRIMLESPNTEKKANPHILDVGCSTGEFLSILRQDFDVEGIEPEPKAAHWAQRLGLKVHNGTLQTYIDQRTSDSVDCEFDLITMWHVLEHVPDPAKELSQLNKLLSSSGRLLVALPNIKSLDSAIYGSCWVALDAPRHLWHFSPDPLEQLARKAGFRLLKSGMLPLDTIYNSLLSEQLCIKTFGNYQMLFTPFRLLGAIIGSTFWGLTTRQHSSKYYLFEKVN